MNYQSWVGVADKNLGYGVMLDGFLKTKPVGVAFNPNASVCVYMNPPHLNETRKVGQYRAAFTMWESDKLPDRFIHWFPQYDQIIAPCQHNVDLFSKYHPNVSYVPLGIDTSYWKPIKREANSTFRFHAGGSGWQRKGLDIVVKAFRQLKLPNAELHIKAPPHAKDTPEEVKGENIYLHRQWVTQDEMRTWLNQADCYVAPSRGEGFGLIPLQTIALGIPTIISDTSGQAQFAHLATGVISGGKSVAKNFEGTWDEPSVTQLAEAMLDHYRNDQSVKAKANAKLATEFSWTNATKKLLAVLPTGKLLADPVEESIVIQIACRVNKTIKADIGKQSFFFEKGQEYTVSEDVFRILSKAGHLLE